MKFSVVWDPVAAERFKGLETKARASLEARKKSRRTKASRDEGLFKQVDKCINLLKDNPRHPSLNTHEFKSLAHPYNKNEKVFEAYAQHKTPSAYRVLWCYGPEKGYITILAITAHP